jgi:molecular chaperone HscA
MPAGMARLEVEFHVDENGLLHVTARELSTGNTQTVEVKPSYGLSDEQVEAMLIDALDHGEADFEVRRLLDARIEAERLLLATEKGLASDADLLDDNERSRIDRAVTALRDAIPVAKAASALQSRMDELDAATHDWAGRRMNRAVQAAIEGKDVSEIARRVERAAGVEAHLDAHARGRS